MSEFIQSGTASALMTFIMILAAWKYPGYRATLWIPKMMLWGAVVCIAWAHGHGGMDEVMALRGPWFLLTGGAFWLVLYYCPPKGGAS